MCDRCSMPTRGAAVWSMVSCDCDATPATGRSGPLAAKKMPAVVARQSQHIQRLNHLREAVQVAPVNFRFGLAWRGDQHQRVLRGRAMEGQEMHFLWQAGIFDFRRQADGLIGFGEPGAACEAREFAALNCEKPTSGRAPLWERSDAAGARSA